MMQRIWAWTQCIAIDASVAGTIIRTFRYHAAGENVKTWLYGLLSLLLLFTAAIVLNIESVQQTLNLTLESAYIHVFVPVEALIWIRSLAIVLLIVAHAMRHVEMKKLPAAGTQPQQATPLIVTPELLENLRVLLAQTIVTEEANSPSLLLPEGEQAANNGERVRAYLVEHPKATLREIADALAISVTTVNKWRTRIQEEGKRVKRMSRRRT